MVHFDDDEQEQEQEEEEYDHLHEDDEELEKDSDDEDDDDDDESSNDDEDDKENPSLSRLVRILKRKVFNEIPHDPNYTPYSLKIRESGIFDFKFAFTKLCEEIRNLVDIQSFWCGLDGFNDQLSQLKEMGYYNVEKVSKRIDILKQIAERERASRAAADKFENEVRDREAKVSDLRTRISDLQAEIEEYKNIITDSKSKIETLKKDSSDAVAEFISIAKQI